MKKILSSLVLMLFAVLNVSAENTSLADFKALKNNSTNRAIEFTITDEVLVTGKFGDGIYVEAGETGLFVSGINASAGDKLTNITGNIARTSGVYNQMVATSCDVVSSGNTVTPLTVSMADFADNAAAYDARLIAIPGVEFDEKCNKDGVFELQTVNTDMCNFPYMISVLANTPFVAQGTVVGYPYMMTGMQAMMSSFRLISIETAAAGWNGTVTTSLDGKTVTSINDFAGLTLTFPGAQSIAILDEEECQYLALQNEDGSELYGIWAPTMGSDYTINGNTITLGGFMEYPGATVAIPAGTTKLYIEDYGTLAIDGEADYLETLEFDANIAGAAEPFALTSITNNDVAGSIVGVEAAEYGMSYNFVVTATDKQLFPGTAEPTLSFDGKIAINFGKANIAAYGYDQAYVRFMDLQTSVFTDPGTYTLILPEGTFVDENGTPSAAAVAKWVIIEKGPFNVVVENATVDTTIDETWGAKDKKYTVTMEFDIPKEAKNIYCEGLFLEDGKQMPFQCGRFGTVEMEGTHVVLTFTDPMICDTDDEEYDGEIREPGTYTATAEIGFMDEDWMEVGYATYTGSIVLPDVVEPVYVTLDITSRVATAWPGAGVCSTEFAPAVTTSDGRTANMAENYQTNVDATGTIISQTITGLENGQYELQMYANAFYTPERGFDSPMEDGAMDVAYIFANDTKEYIKGQIATSTPQNGEYKLVVNVTDGTITLGVGKDKAGTNWHTAQIKSLTLQKPLKEAIAEVVADALAAYPEHSAGYEVMAAACEQIQKARTIKQYEAGVAAINAAKPEAQKAQAEQVLASSSEMTEGQYLLKNVETGMFLGAGNSWGTQASLLPVGDIFTLGKVADGAYSLKSVVSNGNGRQFLNGTYCDSPVEGFHFIRKGATTYALTLDGLNFFTANGSICDLSAQSEDAVAAQWELIALEDAIAALYEASKENPMDATFLIKGHGFGRNNVELGAWNKMSYDGTAAIGNCNISGGNNDLRCAESWRSNNGFNVFQNVNLPNGKYILKGQAVVNDYDAIGENLPVMYANDAETAFAAMTEGESNMTGVCNSFVKGLYTVKPVEFTVTDGVASIGVKCPLTTVWALWDNIEVTYLGGAAETINIAEAEPQFNVDEEPFYGYLSARDFAANGLTVKLANAGTDNFETVKVTATLMASMDHGFGQGGNEGDGIDGGFGPAPVTVVPVLNGEFVAENGVINLDEFAQYINEAGPAAYAVVINTVEVSIAGKVLATYETEGAEFSTMFEVALNPEDLAVLEAIAAAEVEADEFTSSLAIRVANAAIEAAYEALAAEDRTPESCEAAIAALEKEMERARGYEEVYTPIESIAAAGKNAVIYNLNGQRVNNAKGIAIINGKKVVLKK